MRSPTDLHGCALEWIGDPDPETSALITDVLAVSNSVHQGMVVYGPWFEARISHLVRSWLPDGWSTSGPSQIYDPDKPDVRSRSWDVVVHRYPLPGALPEAAPGSGYPLLPIEAIATVIDTKTNFSNPGSYASAVIFNLMNNAEDWQLDFLGEKISKMLLVISSSRDPDWMRAEGAALGLQVYSLGKYRAGPVSDGKDRKLFGTMSALRDGTYPFQLFRQAIEEAVCRRR